MHSSSSAFDFAHRALRASRSPLADAAAAADAADDVELGGTGYEPCHVELVDIPKEFVGGPYEARRGASTRGERRVRRVFLEKRPATLSFPRRAAGDARSP